MAVFLQTALLGCFHLGSLISPSAGCLRGKGASLLELMEGEINTDYSAASEGFVSFGAAVVLMHLLHLDALGFRSATLAEAAPTRSSGCHEGEFTSRN